MSNFIKYYSKNYSKENKRSSNTIKNLHKNKKIYYKSIIIVSIILIIFSLNFKYIKLAYLWFSAGKTQEQRIMNLRLKILSIDPQIELESKQIQTILNMDRENAIRNQFKYLALKSKYKKNMNLRKNLIYILKIQNLSAYDKNHKQPSFTTWYLRTTPIYHSTTKSTF